MRSQVGKFTLVGGALCIGYESGDPVSVVSKSPGTFKEGTVHFVTVSTSKEQYPDLEKQAALKLRD